jgi:uncharacterized repeat protein (TIGR03847 family)
MPNIEIELNPITFITIGTVGPKGKRLFYLQAGDDTQLVTLIIEKEQARALGEAVREMLDELNKRSETQLSSDQPEMSRMNMELREPVEARFRVAQMGLGYDEDRDLVILVAQELVTAQEDEEPEGIQPGVARFWATRQQMRALSQHTLDVVRQGRADPASNGRVLYYWT